MKDLFLHLWKTSRVFQVALVAAVAVAGWAVLGRPSNATPPAANQPLTINTPGGKIQTPFTTQDTEKAKSRVGETVDKGLEAVDSGTKAAKKIADGVTDGADYLRRQAEGYFTPKPPLDPTTPPPAPMNPKTP